MKNIDVNFFPGWTRKAMTFTIDDGWLDMDEKFIGIVKPNGIKGTFNISSHNAVKHDPQRVRAAYRGFEIANHVKYHPFAFADDYVINDANADFSQSSADKSLCYHEKGMPQGVYLRYSEKNERWDRVATTEGYVSLIELCHEDLEELFGKGNVHGFVWPFCAQRNSRLKEYIKERYGSLRDAGKQEPMQDKSFPLPADRANWHYNARHTNLLDRGAEFEALGDDGSLKWFAFGVHSVDFERGEKWDDLKTFCEKYGNRPEDFWYAGVSEIFAYEDAVKAVEISDDMVKNPTDVTLYIKVDGKRITLAPYSEIKL